MTAPPPALDCAHVIEYASVDDTVTFEQRHTLNVGGEWLGRVPRLAICQSFDEATFLVFHCDAEWNVLGVAAGFKSIEEAKAKVERSYRGVAGKWVAGGRSRDEAERYVAERADCELCAPESILSENALAYLLSDTHPLIRGHVLVVPKRHVADFFEMTPQEQAAVVDLLRDAKQLIQAEHAPDGYNIGVNIGKAAGQSRMHVHVHLIPRYVGDVPDPKGGIRCVLAGAKQK